MPSSAPAKNRQPPAPKVDSSIDPSENVKALSDAASQRQDDLRRASEKLMLAHIASIKETEALRCKHQQELRAAESRRVDEQMSLRSSYSERLESAEAKRIDAIRAVDVNAVAVASQRASDQATVLATQVAQSAEALRALVATTAATVAQSLQQLSTSLSTRLTTLEQAGYQAQGKQSYADPAFVELLGQVKELQSKRQEQTGKTAGVANTWGIVVAVATLVLTLFGYILTRPDAKEAQVTPQVLYGPAPIPNTTPVPTPTP